MAATSSTTPPDQPRLSTVVVLGGAGHLGRFVANQLADPHPATGSPRRVVATARDLSSFEDGRPFSDSIIRLASPISPMSDELRREIATAEAVVICLPIQLAAVVAPQVEAIATEAGRAPRLVVFSSTRRHSCVPDPTAREVVEAEARWVASPLRPITLRCSMIFGDHADRNLARVFAWARRHRWIPVPVGRVGRIQPAFAEDLAVAVRSALDAPASLLDALPPDRAIELAGAEPIDPRDLLALCMSLWRRRILVPVPLWALRIGALAAPLLPRGLQVTREQIERLAEEKTVELEPAKRLLGYAPTRLELALAMKLKMEERFFAKRGDAGGDDELSA